MRIFCPHCGERSVDEFVTIGTADPVRPEGSAPIDAFYAYVYLRDNPAGEHREWFYHQAGCRAWLRVTRDTASHRMIGVAPARAPELPGDLVDPAR